jgi:hypothetical protein
MAGGLRMKMPPLTGVRNPVSSAGVTISTELFRISSSLIQPPQKSLDAEQGRAPRIGMPSVVQQIPRKTLDRRAPSCTTDSLVILFEYS